MFSSAGVRPKHEPTRACSDDPRTSADAPSGDAPAGLGLAADTTFKFLQVFGVADWLCDDMEGEVKQVLLG